MSDALPPRPTAALITADEDNLARKKRLDAVAPVLVGAFRRAGLPGVWGIALARQESDFNAKACNNSAADAKRGYSWGLCQMSLQTARDSLGYRGDGPGLTDVGINATLAAQFCRQLMRGHQTSGLADIAALYNSGRVFAHAPPSTATTYVPRVLAFAEHYANLAATLEKGVPAPPQEP